MDTTQVQDFAKVLRVGTSRTLNGRAYSVYVKVAYADGRLSITGVGGPLSGGDALGSCGQIMDEVRDCKPLFPTWDASRVAKLLGVWEKWHLNDMRAGTPRQLEALSGKTFNPLSWYSEACEYLKSVGLFEDNGYRYGSDWLREEVPADVLEFLVGLPETDKVPAWI